MFGDLLDHPQRIADLAPIRLPVELVKLGPRQPRRRRVGFWSDVGDIALMNQLRRAFPDVLSLSLGNVERQAIRA